MGASPEAPDRGRDPTTAAGILKRGWTVAAFLIGGELILLLAAGKLEWAWAWVYLGINLLGVSIVGPITLRRAPAAVAERGQLRVSERLGVH